MNLLKTEKINVCYIIVTYMIHICNSIGNSLGCVLGTRECRNDPIARVNGEQHVL